jgi:hypothetical protein
LRFENLGNVLLCGFYNCFCQECEWAIFSQFSDETSSTANRRNRDSVQHRPMSAYFFSAFSLSFRCASAFMSRVIK